MIFAVLAILLSSSFIFSAGNEACGWSYLYGSDNITIFQLTGKRVVIRPSLPLSPTGFRTSKVKWRAKSQDSQTTKEELRERLSVNRTGGHLIISTMDHALNGSTYNFIYDNTKLHGSAMLILGISPKFQNFSINSSYCMCGGHRSLRKICFKPSGSPLPTVSTNFKEEELMRWKPTSLKQQCIEIDCCLAVTLVASNCFGNDTILVKEDKCNLETRTNLATDTARTYEATVSLLLDEPSTHFKCDNVGDDSPHQEGVCFNQIHELSESDWIKICISLAVMLFLMTLLATASLIAHKIRKGNKEASLTPRVETRDNIPQRSESNEYTEPDYPTVATATVHSEAIYLYPSSIPVSDDSSDIGDYESMKDYQADATRPIHLQPQTSLKPKLSITTQCKQLDYPCCN
ncbi:uncharacterized protein LOC134176787 [Corticium candelabrum]|uniref:uncharacterized protein LOC134176787 n=1 Tax=Corticium candelabrum TaxID=121492 RepID=UPI002E261958|nr:uncharacterized protein LOC134176787 [Corticium candelabrum]